MVSHPKTSSIKRRLGSFSQVRLEESKFFHLGFVSVSKILDLVAIRCLEVLAQLCCEVWGFLLVSFILALLAPLS